jgi:hypothetical protein
MLTNLLLPVGLAVIPFLLGALLRRQLPRARADVLGLFAAMTLLFLIEELPVLPVARMRVTVDAMFHDPFVQYPGWVVAGLFLCIVLARIAVPYLIARAGIRLADRLLRGRRTGVRGRE